VQRDGSFEILQFLRERIRQSRESAAMHTQSVILFFNVTCGDQIDNRTALYRFVDANRKITESARDLLWKSPGLFPKDAVHLASAIEFARKEELDCIHSYDQDFLALNGKLPISCPVRELVPAQPGLGLKVERIKKKEGRRPRSIEL